MQSLYELFMQQDTDNTHDILLEIGADAALKEARQRCPAEGAILVCGSFYLAGEIAEEWKREASCL
jgi:folylpolyglutamate synthase/dihydropteroate synthase